MRDLPHRSRPIDRARRIFPTAASATEEDPTTIPTREARLNSAFLRLSDTLVDDYDTAERMRALVADCTAIFGVEAAGIMLADGGGRLQLFASSGVRTNLVELMQLNAGAGPCVQSFETGEVVSVADIEHSGGAWPGFAAGALQQGYRSAHVIPFRHRSEVIGTLSLWGTTVGTLPAPDAAAAWALAEVATIGILNERLVRERTGTVEQLQRALDNRVLVEQAKGVLAQAWSVEMADAWEIMRRYARTRSMSVHELAASVVERTLDVAIIFSAAQAPPIPPKG